MHLTICYLLILGLSLVLRQIWRSIAASYHHRELTRKYGCQFPRYLPQKDKIFASDVLLEEYRHFRNFTYMDMSVKRFELYGPTWAYKIMGGITLATTDIENIRTILMTKSQLYGLGYTRLSVLGPTIGHGLFTAEGDDWQFLRRITRPEFAASYLNLEPHVQRLMSQIPDDGSPVNLQPIFHNLTLYSATSILWDQHAVDSLDAQQQSLAQRINCGIRNSFSYTQKSIVIGSAAKLVQSSSTKETIDLVNNFIAENTKRIFDLRASSPTKQQGPANESVTGSSYDKFGTRGFDAAHGEIRQMFLAAEGTIPETLTHLFILLSRNPHVLYKLRAEITSQLPPGTLPSTPQQRNKLAYLDACIKETLRMFPTAPFNNRVALQDTVLPRGGGVDGLDPIAVPAGTEVSLPHFPLYRRKDIFGEDADEFVPERWLPTAVHGKSHAQTIQSENYLPFSFGKRACPGRSIALETARYVAVRLLQEFSDVQDASGGQPWQENLGAVLQSKNGVNLRMIKASKYDTEISDSGFESSSLTC